MAAPAEVPVSASTINDVCDVSNGCCRRSSSTINDVCVCGCVCSGHPRRSGAGVGLGTHAGEATQRPLWRTRGVATKWWISKQYL